MIRMQLASSTRTPAPHARETLPNSDQSLSLLFLMACGDDPLSPIEATANFSAATSTELPGTVGLPVTQVPAVKAIDQGGDPVSGADVAFTVTGGGTIARTTATTDADGVADVGSWILGTAVGTQTVVASAGSHVVTFTATAAAGAAASIAPAGGATNEALTGGEVPTPPAAVVEDQYGNPVSGAPVVFSVVEGGGTVDGASATTDANGVATVGEWRLGIVPGPQTLRATSGSLAADFTATAALPTGCVPAIYAVGAVIPAMWEEGDCANATAFAPAGALYDEYSLSLDAQENVRFELTGATGRTLRIRRAGTTEYVGLPLGPSFTTVEGSTLVTRHLLGAGDYVVEVQAPASATGEYTLSSAADDSDIVCRPMVQGSIGITFEGQLDEATDCESPVAAGTYED
jgi:adhesin/invasin